MRRPRSRPRWPHVVGPILAVGLACGPAIAQSRPQLGALPKPGVKRARTLGEIAGWIVLTNPAGSAHERIVINDANLSTAAHLGVISEGSSTWKPSKADEERQRQAAETAQQSWKERLDTQQREVERAEQRLQQMDSRASQRQGAYPSQGSPYNRPGGVQSPSQLEREQAARELEQARRELDRSTRAAGREGYRHK